MSGKRANLIEGETDQITVRLPKSRLRFHAAAVPDIGAWLMMLQARYDRQYHALRDAAKHGADTAGGIQFAGAACKLLADLSARVAEAWTVRDWHEAQAMWAAVCSDMGLDLAARPTSVPPPADTNGGG